MMSKPARIVLAVVGAGCMAVGALCWLGTGDAGLVNTGMLAMLILLVDDRLPKGGTP